MVLQILSLAVLPWLAAGGLDPSVARGSATAGQLPGLLRTLRAAFAVGGLSGQLDTGIAPAWFSWLGATVVAVVAALVLLGLLSAGLPGTAARALGVLGAVAGVGFCFWALAVARWGRRAEAATGLASPTYGGYLGHAGAGLWCGVAGFVLLGAAGVLGAPGAGRPRDPTRRRRADA